MSCTIHSPMGRAHAELQVTNQKVVTSSVRECNRGHRQLFFFCASISVAVATLHTDRHPQLLMRFIEDE